MRAGNCAAQQRGYVLVWLLALMALAGCGLAAVGEIWSLDAQRDRERELVQVGGQYAQAIASYYYASPPTKREFPRTLQALIEDTRSTPPRRHLRRLFPDPMAPGKPWGVVQRADGAILGVYSDNDGRPVTQVEVESGGITLPVVGQYRDWKFNAKVHP